MLVKSLLSVSECGFQVRNSFIIVDSSLLKFRVSFTHRNVHVVFLFIPQSKCKKHMICTRAVIDCPPATSCQESRNIAHVHGPCIIVLIVLINYLFIVFGQGYCCCTELMSPRTACFEFPLPVELSGIHHWEVATACAKYLYVLVLPRQPASAYYRSKQNAFNAFTARPSDPSAPQGAVVLSLKQDDYPICTLSARLYHSGIRIQDSLKRCSHTYITLSLSLIAVFHELPWLKCHP